MCLCRQGMRLNHAAIGEIAQVDTPSGSASILLALVNRGNEGEPGTHLWVSRAPRKYTSSQNPDMSQ